ncbi:hypothetical protein ACFW9X_31430, partial [Streptomyces sp. NPDC059466]
GGGPTHTRGPAPRAAAPGRPVGGAPRAPPSGGAGAPARPATASEAHGHDGIGGENAGGYENAGNASTRPGGRFSKGDGTPDVSVEVTSAAGAGSAAGQLSVQATGSGDTTFITLTASGSSTVHWSARSGAPWLYLSRSSGALAPGESVTIKVHVDQLRQPVGHWSARVAIAPAGAVVTIGGYGSAGPSAPGGSGPGPAPGSPTPSGPGSATPSSGPDPSPTPSDPSPTPTPTNPTPSHPDGSTPPPAGTGDPVPS